MNEVGPAANRAAKVGRNDPCPCGSGRKYKHCCQTKDPGAEFATGTAREPPRSAALGIGCRRYSSQPRSTGTPEGRLRRFHCSGKSRGSTRTVRRRTTTSASRVCAPAGSSRRRPACSGRWSCSPASTARSAILQPPFSSRGASAKLSSPFASLARRADDPIERRFYSARALAMEGKPEEAEKQLRRLLAHAPKRPRHGRSSGEVISNRGMFEEAAQPLALAVEDFPPAFQQMTTVKRMTEADRPLLDRMRSLAERPGLDVLSRIAVHFGLGKAYEDLGDYAVAMRHYEEGNRLRAMSARLDRPALAARYDSLVSRFTAESLQRVRQALAKPVPGRRPAGVHRRHPSVRQHADRADPASHPAVAAGGELSFWADRLGGWHPAELRLLEAGLLAKAAQDFHAGSRKSGLGRCE